MYQPENQRRTWRMIQENQTTLWWIYAWTWNFRRKRESIPKYQNQKDRLKGSGRLSGECKFFRLHAVLCLSSWRHEYGCTRLETDFWKEMGDSLRMCLFKGMEIQKIAISSFCSSGRLEDSHIAWIASQNLVASSAMLSAFRLRSAAYVPSIHLPINDLNQSIKQNTKTHDKETNSRNPMYLWDTIWFGIHVVVINISFYILHGCFPICFCHFLHICRRPPRWPVWFLVLSARSAASPVRNHRVEASHHTVTPSHPPGWSRHLRPPNRFKHPKVTNQKSSSEPISTLWKTLLNSEQFIVMSYTYQKWKPDSLSRKENNLSDENVPSFLEKRKRWHDLAGLLCTNENHRLGSNPTERASEQWKKNRLVNKDPFHGLF